MNGRIRMMRNIRLSSALLSFLLISVSLLPYTNGYGKIFVGQVRHVPPEEAPIFNVSSAWEELFRNMSRFGEENLSLIPTYDFVDMFQNGLLDPMKIVFIVYPKDPPEYWRLEAYDYFDGFRWYKMNQTKIEKTSLDDLPEGGNVFLVYLNISHTNVDSRYIPTLWPIPLVINYSSPDSFSVHFYLDDYGSLIMDSIYEGSGESPFEYATGNLPVNVDYIIEHALPYNYTPDYISSRYAQVPDTLSPQVYEFAYQFENVGKNVYEKAVSVMSYLKANFEFNLEMFLEGSSDRPVDEDIVSWFLNRGSGVASHFVSTFVTTLRILGISARPVFGFTSGFVEGDRRIIRAINAHVWAEVWIPTDDGEAWVPFDPTPLPDIVKGDGGENVIDVYYELDISLPDDVVGRGEEVKVYCNLTENGNPLSGVEITLFDVQEDEIIGVNVTNSEGYTEFSYFYNETNVAGPHTIVVYCEYARNETLLYLKGQSLIELEKKDKAYWGDYLTISGNVTDPLNGRPIGGIYVAVLWDGEVVENMETDEYGRFSFSYYVDPFDPKNKLGEHNLTFYSILVHPEPYELIVAPSSYQFYLNVCTVPNLSINAENSVRRGSELRVSGTLILLNNTPLVGYQVSVYWDNGSSPLYYEVADTNSSGMFQTYLEVPLYHDPMEVVVYANFSSPLEPWIESTKSNELRVSVYMTINATLTWISSDNVTHGEKLTIIGYVRNETGGFVPNKKMVVLLNSSILIVNGLMLYNTTDESGVFELSFEVPNDITGKYNVSVSSIDDYTEAICENPQMIEAWSYTHMSLTGSLEYMLSGESVILTGYVVDDLGGTLDGTVRVYVDEEPKGTIDYNGTFEFNYTAPNTYDNVTVYLEFNYVGKKYYLPCSENIDIVVFRNASIEIKSEKNLARPEDSIDLYVNLTSDKGYPIPGRFVRIYVIVDGVKDVVAEGYTNESGIFEAHYEVPKSIKSDELIVYAELVSTLSLKSDDLKIKVMTLGQVFDLGTLVLILVSLSSVVVVYILVRKGILKIPLRFGGSKVPSFNYRAVIEQITELFRTEKYREGILLSKDLLQGILREYKGISKSDSETFREFMYKAANSLGIPISDVEDYLSSYEKARFSDEEIGVEDYAKMVQSITRMISIITGEEIRFA
ncbi:MAG: transglutaminase domain-containing protein [Candidatus Asgardarchaeia archaeon]